MSVSRRKHGVAQEMLGEGGVISNRAASFLKSIDSGSRLLTSLSAAVKPAQMPSFCMCLGVSLGSQGQLIACPASRLTRYSPQVPYRLHPASPTDLRHHKASYHKRSRKI